MNLATNNRFTRSVILVAVIFAFLYTISIVFSVAPPPRLLAKVGWSGGYSSFEDEYMTPSKSRPLDGYVVDQAKVMKQCNMDKYSAEECLQYLDTQESDYVVHYTQLGVPKPPDCNPDEEPMLFHVYWKGPFTDKIALMVKSFLFTQPLECARLWVWLDGGDDLNKNIYALPLLDFAGKYVDFKVWNTAEQLDSFPEYEGWRNILDPLRPVAFSDMVRFVVLHRYGGMYMDADVLFLRDMRPLYHANFEYAYQWSYRQDYNTAALRLFRNSTTSKAVISKAMLNDMTFHPFNIKEYLQEAVGKKGDINSMLLMMSVPLFDPLWLKSDGRQPESILSPNIKTFVDAFNPDPVEGEFPSIKGHILNTERRIENFFSGAFTYHWHNNWHTAILPGSWIGTLDTAYTDFITGSRRNIFGERISIMTKK